MKNDHREITSATVTVTLTLSDLGVFGPGSSYDQAKQAATLRIIEALKLSADAVESVIVRAVSFESSGSTCRQRLAASGKAYQKSSCAICGPFSPRWRECDAAIALESKSDDS